MAHVPNAILVLLSDLHFGDDLLDEGAGKLRGVPWRIRLLSPAIRRYFHSRLTRHDMGILKMLPLYLKRLLEDLRAAGFERDNFDLYVLLGDLATEPTGSSFQFVQSNQELLRRL